MKEETREILEKAFDKKDIGKDYGKNDYVKPHLIIRRLNKAFGQDGWQFIPEERIVEHDTIIQFGKLGVKDENGEWIWKHNCGARRCAYLTDRDKKPTDKRLDVGNDYKSAVSNCLKRCAMMLGVALDLYGDPEHDAESAGDSPGAPSSGSGGDKGAEEKRGATKGSGSAGGGEGKPKKAEDAGEENVNTVMAEALELQRAYMMANKANDKEARKAILGTETKPEGYEAWKMYRDLLSGDGGGPGDLPEGLKDKFGENGGVEE